MIEREKVEYSNAIKEEKRVIVVETGGSGWITEAGKEKEKERETNCIQRNESINGPLETVRSSSALDGDQHCRVQEKHCRVNTLSSQ
jgi:hypothetical protein